MDISKESAEFLKTHLSGSIDELPKDILDNFHETVRIALEMRSLYNDRLIAILAIKPDMDTSNLKHYLDWLDEEAETTMEIEVLYDMFAYAFAEINSRECHIIFGVWFATMNLRLA